MMDFDLLKKVSEYRKSGVDVALLTVVKAKGSTPLKAGAKMAILENGTSLGTIGGGCVEAKARTCAMKVLFEEQKSQSILIELNDEIGTKDGDVCGGTMDVLIEYLKGKSAGE